MKNKFSKKVLFFINFSLFILITTLFSSSLILTIKNQEDKNNNHYSYYNILIKNNNYNIIQDSIEFEFHNNNNYENNYYYYEIVEDFINNDLTNKKIHLEDEYYISKFITMEFFFAKHNLFSGSFGFNNIFEVFFCLINNINNINWYIYERSIIWLKPNEFEIFIYEYRIYTNNSNTKIELIWTDYRNFEITIDDWSGYYLLDENYKYFYEINQFIYDKLLELKQFTKSKLWNISLAITTNLSMYIDNLKRFLISIYIYENLLNKQKDFYSSKLKQKQQIVTKKIQFTMIIWRLANKFQNILIHNTNGQIDIHLCFEFKDNTWIYSFEYNNQITYEVIDNQLSFTLENDRQDAIKIEKIYRENILLIIFLITITFILILIIILGTFLYIKKQRFIKQNYYL